MLARIERMLGASKKPAHASQLRAAGAIEPKGSGYELRLSIEGGRGGERVVFAQRCDELGGVAAVALVLLLTGGADPSDAEGPTDGPMDGPMGDGSSGSPPAPSPAGASGQEPLTPSEPAEAPDDGAAAGEGAEGGAGEGASARWRLLVDAPLFGLGVGPLPKPYPGLGIGVGAERGAFSLRLTGQWGLAQDIPASTPGYGAELRRLSAGMWVCAEVSESPVGIAPCLHGSVTHLTGRGYGPDLAAVSQSETSAAVGLGLLGRWQIGSGVALLVGGSGQVEFSRPVLVLKPLGSFQQLAPISATLLLGPEWIF